VLHTLLRLDTTGPPWPPARGCRLMRRRVRICALLGASYTTLPGAVFKDKDEDGDAALGVLRCMRHCASAAASGAAGWYPQTRALGNPPDGPSIEGVGELEGQGHAADVGVPWPGSRGSRLHSTVLRPRRSPQRPTLTCNARV
jgi:hypothetical protein